jgi:hypothetical protein
LKCALVTFRPKVGDLVIGGTIHKSALEGAKQKIGLHLIPLPDAPQVEKVRANGSDLEMVESLRLDLNSGVGWSSDPDGALRVVVG